MSKTYTTKTASLKATTADVRKIDAEEIKVWTGNTTNRKERVSLLDLISDSNIIYDDRGGIITEYDIWPNPITLENTFITTDTNGNISINHSTDTYHTSDYSEMKNDHKTILQSAAKVIDNKVLAANGQLLMNWETAAFTNTNGSSMSSIFGGSGSHDAPITEWDSDLSSLTNGDNMFYETALQSFKGDLSSLTDGRYMFYMSDLTSFNGDLSSLTNGDGMFYYTDIEAFNGDLSSLTRGDFMFNSTPLTSFNADLSSLTIGYQMFYACKLDAESVHNILHTINPNEKTGTGEGTITIGTNIINDSTLEAQKLEFAKVCLCDSWSELDDEFDAKHWTVEWQFNGSASSSASTLELTDSNISTALWAKLEEVTEENAPYKYVSEEDGKHYNISWFHETNGSTEGYEYFGSLLEACGAFGVIPKEYAESNN